MISGLSAGNHFDPHIPSAPAMMLDFLSLPNKTVFICHWCGEIHVQAKYSEQKKRLHEKNFLVQAIGERN